MNYESQQYIKARTGSGFALAVTGLDESYTALAAAITGQASGITAASVTGDSDEWVLSWSAPSAGLHHLEVVASDGDGHCVVVYRGVLDVQAGLASVSSSTLKYCLHVDVVNTEVTTSLVLGAAYDAELSAMSSRIAVLEAGGGAGGSLPAWSSCITGTAAGISSIQLTGNMMLNATAVETIGFNATNINELQTRVDELRTDVDELQAGGGGSGGSLPAWSSCIVGSASGIESIQMLGGSVFTATTMHDLRLLQTQVDELESSGGSGSLPAWSSCIVGNASGIESIQMRDAGYLTGTTLGEFAALQTIVEELRTDVDELQAGGGGSDGSGTTLPAWLSGVQSSGTGVISIRMADGRDINGTLLNCIGMVEDHETRISTLEQA